MPEIFYICSVHGWNEYDTATWLGFPLLLMRVVPNQGQQGLAEGKQTSRLGLWKPCTIR